MSGKELSFFKRALGVGRSQKSKSAQGADSAPAGQGAQAAQAAQSSQSAQAAPAVQGAQAAQVTQAAQSAQAAQAAPADQGAQTSQASQETESPKRTFVVKRTPIPDPPRVYVGQGALKKQPMPGTQSAQGGKSSTKRQELDSPRPGRAPVPDSPRGYGGQGAVKRQPDQATLRRQALEAQIEQSAMRRQGAQGSPRAQESPSTSRAQPSTSEPQPSTSGTQPSTSEGFTGSLSRFASAWVTHKGLETWAKLARDKNQKTNSESESPKDTRDVNINPETRTVQPSTSTAPHVVNPDVPTSPFELPHQARSCPGISGRTYARLNRTLSMSSQGSMDSATGKQGSDNRGSSPQIRNYSPERRSGQMYDEACGGFTIPTPATFRAGPYDSRGQCSSQGSLSSTSSLAPGSPRTRSMMKGVSVDSHGVPSSPFGQLQPELYSQRNSPMIIPLHGHGPSLGRLHLRLQFDYDRSDLNVHIIEIHDLPLGDDGGFNEPYVRMEMVPGVDNKKRETTTVANNNNPLFDQHFKFPIAHEELEFRTLIFQIYDYDRFTESDIIGEVRIEMSDLELVSSIEIWAELARTKKPREEYQELLLSLSYLPSAQRLTIVVLKARNLYIIPSKGTVDPFVKIYLMAEGKRTKKRKTHTKKGNRNPVWNEAFTFNIASKALAKAIMEVCVYDHSHEFMSSNNQIIGSCLLGLSEEGNEREHWVEVTGSPRKTVAMWHTLR